MTPPTAISPTHKGSTPQITPPPLQPKKNENSMHINLLQPTSLHNEFLLCGQPQLSPQEVSPSDNNGHPPGIGVVLSTAATGQDNNNRPIPTLPSTALKNELTQGNTKQTYGPGLILPEKHSVNASHRRAAAFRSSTVIEHLTQKK